MTFTSAFILAKNAAASKIFISPFYIFSADNGTLNKGTILLFREAVKLKRKIKHHRCVIEEMKYHNSLSSRDIITLRLSYSLCIVNSAVKLPNLVISTYPE